MKLLRLVKTLAVTCASWSLSAKVNYTVPLVVGFTFIAMGAAPDRVVTTLKKYEALRPQREDLRVFELNWEPTLKSAVMRAAKERRPVLLIVVQNSNGDIRQGHC